MRRLLSVLFSVALLVTLVAAPVSAKKADWAEKYLDRHAETVTFWINATESIEFQPVDFITLTSKSETGEIGATCTLGGTDIFTNEAVVQVSEVTGGESIAVEVLLDEPAMRQALVFGVAQTDADLGVPGLPGYCYSDSDGQWYAQFDGLLINHHMPDHLIQRIVAYLES